MKLGIMFTGQGSETVGMGSSLLEYESVKTLYKQAETILGYDPEVALNTEETFSDTAKIQPLTFLMQVSILTLLKEHGVSSDVTFGLSLGEYAAMYDAGVFDFETGIRLLKERGRLMQEAAINHPGSMCALIGLKAPKLEELIGTMDDVVIANYNTPRQLVISGTKTAVETASELAKENGAKRAIMLPTTGAFHSFLMKDAADLFAEYLEEVKVGLPSKALYVNVTGDRLAEDIKDNMVKQITSSVMFYPMVEKNDDLDLLIEVGPKPVLCNMVKRINRKLPTKAVYDKSSLNDVLEALQNEI